jgi:hypothetical protein
MLRILIADGAPAAMQAESETFGFPRTFRFSELRSSRSRRADLHGLAVPVLRAALCNVQVHERRVRI